MTLSALGNFARTTHAPRGYTAATMSSTKAADAAVQIAEAIVAGLPDHSLLEHANALSDGNKNTTALAAHVFDEIIARKPDLAAPHIERIIRMLASDNARVAQTCANALPELARVAPAKVAKHLPKLNSAFEQGSDVAKEGVVRTFAALCVASVAYQKRLIGSMETALASADEKTLQRWTEIILPALKGEPHAQARAVVERRLYELPRPIAQKIATFLGIKLRPAPAR